jgi:NADPH:quinone reductase-like Zn-dependent oxidoreductase
VLAVSVTRLDGPASLEIAQVPVPRARTDGILVDVRAAGVTLPDLLQTYGKYQVRLPLPFVLGSEVAGVVRSAPAGSGFAAGDRVAGLTIGGGFVNRLLLRNIDVVGVSWGGWFSSNDSFLAGQWSELLRLYSDGTLRCPLRRTVRWPKCGRCWPLWSDANPSARSC